MSTRDFAMELFFTGLNTFVWAITFQVKNLTNKNCEKNWEKNWDEILIEKKVISLYETKN